MTATDRRKVEDGTGGEAGPERPFRWLPLAAEGQAVLKDLPAVATTVALVAAVTVCAAVVLVVVLRRTFVVVTVTGLSMLPTYRPGDRVIVRRGRVPANGGEVVVEMPRIEDRTWRSAAAGLGAPGADVTRRSWLIKRVAGVPGDVCSPLSGESVEVPPGHLFLLGDNADLSFDSRQMGPFRSDRVLGSVWFRL